MMTIILTLRGGGEQIVPPFILFRGQGQLDADVIAELDEQKIPYAFNEKAWANEEACLEHLVFFSKIVKERCPEAKEHMLLLDGLTAQATSRFVDLALDLNAWLLGSRGPGMRCSELKKNCITRHGPIIALMALCVPTIRDSLLSSGCVLPGTY